MRLLLRFISTNQSSMLLFLLVGALSAIVNFASFSLLWKIFSINYQIAVSIAYILSVIVHFTSNRTITFKSYRENALQQIKKYLVLIVINYIITLMTLHIAVMILNLSPFLGIIFAIGLTVCTGYLISQFWVFRIVTE